MSTPSMPNPPNVPEPSSTSSTPSAPQQGPPPAGQPVQPVPPGPPVPPGYHPPPRRRQLTVPLGKMLYLCVAALGVINLFLGYVNSNDGGATVNLYKAGVAVFALAPTMLFLAGLVAVRGLLPGERTPGALPAMITSAIFVTLVLSALGSAGAGDLQTLFLVFGGLQFVIAWLAYLFDSGVLAGG